MLRRLATRRNCPNDSDSSGPVRSFRDGCHDFVSWDSDDGMFDHVWVNSREITPSWSIRCNSNTEESEQQITNTRRRVLYSSRTMNSDEEESEGTRPHFWVMQQGMDSGIAIATEAENRELMADMRDSFSHNNPHHSNQDIWKKTNKPRKEGEKRKSRRLSLTMPRFTKKKKEEDLCGSVLV